MTRKIAVEVPDDDCLNCCGFDREFTLGMAFCNIYRHTLYRNGWIQPCAECLKATIKSHACQTCQFYPHEFIIKNGKEEIREPCKSCWIMNTPSNWKIKETVKENDK